MKPASPPETPAGPWAALVAVTHHGPSAGDPLVRWLWSRPWRQVPAREREDHLQAVGCVLLCRACDIRASLERRHGRLAPGPTADRSLTAYVGSMFRNRLRDQVRRTAPGPLEGSMAACRPHGEGLVDTLDTVRVIEEGWNRACSMRPSVARALRQLRALTFECTTMEVLVEEITGPLPAPAEFRTVRDRIYMQHRRARTALKRSITDLVEEGRVPRARAEAATRWVDRMLVRRRVLPCSSAA